LDKFVWNTLHIEHVGYEIDENDHNCKKKIFARHFIHEDK